ncbi:hypothetical protein C7S15_4782 [Burkholderia cepacia]|nr:hypothetical protein [Burkholderia cepacia]
MFETYFSYGDGGIAQSLGSFHALFAGESVYSLARVRTLDRTRTSLFDNQ